MAKLIVNPSLPSRRELALSQATALTIGRDPSNDLVLPDAMVSRRHALVEYRGGRYLLRDCNSANGSVVNGYPVSERELHDGDQVAIGTARLLFREDRPESASGKVVQHPSATPLVCPSCGSEYRRGDLFCRECGAQVAEPSGPPRAVCSSCGAAVSLPARFCNGCGGALLARPEHGEASTARDTGPLAVSRPLAPPDPPRAAGSMAIAPQRRSLPSPAEPPEARGLEQPTSGPAEPGSRLAAAFVDAVFVASGQVVLLAPAVWYWWAREVPRTPAEVAFLPVLASVSLLPLALLLGALYHVYFWTTKGATPGKELLDLRVQAEDGRSPIGFGRATLRVFGYLLGVASLGVGFLMIVFAGGGLHDRIAGTRVVRVTRR